MQITLTVCDRCGLQFDGTVQQERTLKLYNHGVMVDLCEECYQKLYDFKIRLGDKGEKYGYNQ